MSNIAERCYSAGWMQHLEYVLWNAVLHGERKYGQDKVTQQDIAELKRLAQTANSWIFFDDSTEETAIELNDWKEIFQREVEKNPDLLKG